jgi:hypothetical protein
MGTVSKPLVGLLAATVIFAVLWVVALKPGGSSGSGGVGQYQGAIDAAHHAVQIANDSGIAAPKSVTTTRASVTPVTLTKPKAPITLAARRATAGASARGAALAADAALEHHQPVALLFYNPAGADDRAVLREFTALATGFPRLRMYSVPASQLSLFSSLADQIPVVQTPTTVIINSAEQATAIVGFADTLEIRERIADALRR